MDAAVRGLIACLYAYRKVVRKCYIDEVIRNVRVAMVVRPATFVGALLRDRITIADAVRDGRAEPAKLHGPYLLAEPVAADGDETATRFYLEEYMAESSAVVHERESLRLRLIQLQKALTTLRGVSVSGARSRGAASASASGRGSGGGGGGA